MQKISMLIIILALAIPAIARAADPAIQEFELSTPGHRPQAIVADADGNLWVTEVIKHKILRVSPKGEITEFAVPGEGVGVLQGIAVGKDGKIYFTSREENAIRRMSRDGKFEETYKIPSTAVGAPTLTKGSWPRAICAGPDGSMWFAEMAANKIGRLTPDGKINEYQVPTNDSKPYGVVVGPDKMLWFTESGGDKIGRLNPDSGKIDEFELPSKKALPRDICVGPDGAIWFSENTVNKIGRISTDGKVTEFPIPTKDSAPIGITAGGDGNIWFTEFKAGKIAKMTPAGKITEYPLPTEKAQPFCFCTAPDGNVWVAEQANRIAKVDVKAK